MKETRKLREYEIDIYWDEQDQIFVAEIPELSGCAAHGDSRAEALFNAEVAISNWLRAPREIEKQFPSRDREWPQHKPTGFRLRPLSSRQALAPRPCWFVQSWRFNIRIGVVK